MKARNIAGPVVRGSDFWGRSAEVTQLWALLTRGSVLLTGPRRHGKSSLMYAISDDPQPNLTVILLDVEWVETPEEFLTTMAGELLSFAPIRRLLAGIKATPSAFTKWISGIVDEVDVGTGNVGELKIRLKERLDRDQWPELAEQMLSTLRSMSDRVVLILDEFPIMVSNMLDRDQASALRFLRWFRTYRQSPGTERLTFLLGGSTNIEPRLESLRAEAVLGDLQRFRIMPFESLKARSFVAELLSSEGIEFEATVPDAILAVCRSGVPYYLQVMVAECLADARRRGRALNTTDVRDIYEEFVIGPVNRHRFSHYHTRLRSHYGDSEQPARVILAALCAGSQTTAALQHALAVAGYAQRELEPTLVLLEGDYYISRSGDSVEFSDGLLRDWWSRNSTAPRAKP